MSSPSLNSLSAGVQQLYNNGLLPTGLSTSTIKGSSAGQLNQLASGSIALQETAALFGNGDSSSLSSTANNALLQEINPSTASSSASTTDPLTAAVNNALTSNLDAAASKFLPQSSSTSGTVNVVG